MYTQSFAFSEPMFGLKDWVFMHDVINICTKLPIYAYKAILGLICVLDYLLETNTLLEYISIFEILPFTTESEGVHFTFSELT